MSERTVSAELGEGASLPVPLDEVERAVESVLDAEGVAEAEISVAFVCDAQIAEMNERFLSHEGVTDVISFPLHLPGGAPLGDIYIGAEQAVRQAPGEAREEILRLAIHGTLHILGYEHPEGEDREGSPMYLRQEELLAAFLAARGA